jgi:hypothetical protein
MRQWMAAGLLVLTLPGGQTVDVNPHKIISLRPPLYEGHVDNDVHCVVDTSNGKFIGVMETCAAVLSKFNDGEKY